MQESQIRRCFVAIPIGEPGSEERIHSDSVFHGIIKPAAKNAGFKAYRAIDDPKPGTITHHIIRSVIDSEAMIADLSYHNPNVYYELAIRHSFNKPVVLICREDHTPAKFDIDSEYIIFLPSNPTYADPLRIQNMITKQIDEARFGESKSPNPIRAASRATSDEYVRIIAANLLTLKLDLLKQNSRWNLALDILSAIPDNDKSIRRLETLREKMIEDLFRRFNGIQESMELVEAGNVLAQLRGQVESEINILRSEESKGISINFQHIANIDSQLMLLEEEIYKALVSKGYRMSNKPAPLLIHALGRFTLGQYQ